MLSLWKQSSNVDQTGRDAEHRKIVEVDGPDDDPRPKKRSRRNSPEPILGSFTPSTAPADVLKSSSQILDHVLDQTKRVNTTAAFGSWKEFSQSPKSLVQYYIEVETDYGFRSASPGRRLVIYAVQNANDIARNAQTIANAIGIRVGALTGDPTITTWRQAALCHDFVILHGPTLLAALLDDLLRPSEISLCIIDSRLANEWSECTKLLDLLTKSDTAKQPRLFVALLHKQSDPEPTIAEQIDSLARITLCAPFIPPTSTLNLSHEVVFYVDDHGTTSDTGLLAKISSLDPKRMLQALYDEANEVLHELGSCAADMFLKCSERGIRRTVNAALPGRDGEQFLEPVLKMALESPLTPLKMSGEGKNVTVKFIQLVGILKGFKTEKDSFRCIVFVRRKSVANTIVMMLNALGVQLDFVTAFAMTRSSCSRPALQQRVLGDFTHGRINTLVCTNIADDLDLPECRIAIRFSLSQNMLSYALTARVVQSGGRLVLMARRDGIVDRRFLLKLSDYSSQLWDWIPLFKKSESAVSPFSLEGPIDESVDDDDNLVNEDDSCIRDPIAGGCIGPLDAVTVIHRAAARLAAVHGSGALQQLFKYTESTTSSGHILCTVLLPLGSSIQQHQGPPSKSRMDARQTACFGLCLRLHQIGELDYRLFPLCRRSRSPDEQSSTAESALDVTEAGVRLYPRHTVMFWDYVQTDAIFSPTVVYIDGHDDLGLPRRPILLLTRTVLPSIQQFNLYFDGHPETVRFQTAGPSFRLDAKQQELLHTYTMRISRGLTNKAITCLPGTMPYFLAPWQPSFSIHDGPIVDRIPWDEIREGSADYIKGISQPDFRMSEAKLRDLVLQDRWSEFTRRFRGFAVRSDMNPHSKPPPDALGVQHNSFAEQYASRVKTPVTALKDDDQPMFEVIRLHGLVNRLFPASRSIEEEPGPPKFIIPEVTARFVIPASTFETAHLIPCCLRRFEESLIVKMLNQQFFDNEIREDLLLCALSTPSLCGEVDYQRLELLGDSVLKFLASASLYVQKGDAPESELHLARQNIISNRALLNAARRVGLFRFILTKPLSVKSWIPPRHDFEPDKPKELSEEDAKDPEKVAAAQVAKERRAQADIRARNKRQQDRSEHWIGDKTVADVTEAILGAAFLSGGKNLVLKAASRLTVPLHDYIGLPSITSSAPPNSFGQLRAESRIFIEGLVGRPISKAHLVAQALTHSTNPASNHMSYQRLEFLGDAILDFLVVRYIWRFENLDPGALTLLKNAMVSNSALAALCVHTRLHEHMTHNSQALAGKIHAYIVALDEARGREQALAELESRPPIQYWLELEHPKPLSDVIESLLGALFVSEDYAIAALEAFFENVMRPFYDEHIRLSGCSTHPTSTLFKILESRSCQKFERERTTQDRGTVRSDVVVHDTVLATATGSTKNAASRKASFEALLALERDPSFLSRTCDCRAILAGKKQAKQAQKSGKTSKSDGKGGTKLKKPA